MQGPNLEEKLKHLPDSPGVYKLLDKNNHVLYIGKAKSLKNRVRSYFQDKIERQLTRILSKKIKDLDFIITRNEKEALILENNLIKEHQPYFNINLKDNKTYPYLKLTSDEKHPRLIKTRTHMGKGDYFGPYTDLATMHHFKNMINDIFPLKKCYRRVFPKNFKPCLYYHIDKCLPYCTGQVSQEEINQLTSQVKSVFTGKKEDVKKMITEKMHTARKRNNFEVAMKLRDQVQALEKMDERQQVSLNHTENMDVMHYHLSDKIIIFTVLNFRVGKLIDKRSFHFESEFLNKEIDDIDFLQSLKDLYPSFLLQYYQDFPTPPVGECLLPIDLSDKQELEEIITEHFITKNELVDLKIKFEINTPLKGERKHLMELAQSNARLSFHELIKDRERKNFSKHLKDLLKLTKAPRTIESFDIANTADRAILAGMVHFENGAPNKEHYRIFNIQSTTRQDDFASMEEAVYRRYKRVKEEKGLMPDLILIDGGKGQLSAAVHALTRLKILGQPIVSLAKREEELYVPKKKDPLKIEWSHPGLNFLIEVRDETHRWANGSHVKKRDREELKSILESIPGLGSKKIKTLFQHFDHIQSIMLASKEEIMALPFFGEKDFAAIQAHFATQKNITNGRH